MQTSRITSLLTAVSLLAFTTAAHAQGARVDQVQLDDSFATLNIEVSEARDVSGAAVAGSNSLTAQSDQQNIDVTSDQHADGSANAQANVTAWHVDGALIANSTATNNGFVAEATGASIRGNATQTAHGDANAQTRVRNDDAWVAASSASAGNNVAVLDAEDGDINARLVQDSTGSVNASVEADHCCVATQVSAASVASANNVTQAGYTTTLITEVDQRSTGASVSARTDLYAGYASDAVGNATANGNATTVNNEWGYTNVLARQENTSNVSAESYVTLGGDWLGYGSASSYGVGNSTIVSNVGADTAMNVMQSNSGAIDSHAALAGAGGDAYASSAAYGNVISGGLCTTVCAPEDSVLSATTMQTNAGPVRSSATISASRGDNVAASATAIGNTASFNSTGRGP